MQNELKFNSLLELKTRLKPALNSKYLELKRKHIDYNEDNALITGKNPLKTFMIARRMFEELQDTILDDFLNQVNIVIYAHWVDSRRRDIYYKALKRYGYDWGRVQGRKVILKRFEKGDYVTKYYLLSSLFHYYSSISII